MTARIGNTPYLLLGLVLPVGAVLLWWLGSAQSWISAQVLPAPALVLKTFERMLGNGELLRNLTASVYRVTLGFSLGATVGLVLGLAMGYWSIVRRLLYPLFRLTAAVPILGWLPLLMLLLGIDEALKVVLIAKAAFIPVTLNTYQGVRSVPRNYREVGALYQFNSWQVFRQLLLPCAFPSIWGGIRFGISRCWMALVLVELLSSTEGVGYLMFSGQQLMQMDLVVVSVVVVAFIGLLVDGILEVVGWRLLRWRPRGAGQ